MVLLQHAGEDTAMAFPRERVCEPRSRRSRYAVTAPRRIRERLGQIHLVWREVEPRIEVRDVRAHFGDPARRDDRAGFPRDVAPVSSFPTLAMVVVVCLEKAEVERQ